MYFLYSLGLGVALVVALPWWGLRMLSSGRYRAGLGERLGRVPRRLHAGDRPGIWIHAVSVGEVLAVSGLVEELRQRFPSHRVFISTTTKTGQELARERFGEENVFYFPLDFAFAVRAYLRALRPELVVLAETEFWPNFLRLGAGAAPVAVVNSRISDRSYPKYKALRFLWWRMLRNVRVFLAQSEEDARRLRDIGAPAERVEVGGNLKFDVKAPADKPIVERLRQTLRRSGAEGVLVCGSTVEGEEELVLEAFRAVQAKHPAAALLLAPRHPERFDEVARLLESSGLRWWRRSESRGDEPLAGGALLLDTIGELAAVYGLADVAFVGGSLTPRGGHNILEPAQFGKAIVVGPHTENFRDIVGIFRQGDAVRVVAHESLASELLRLFDDAAEREALGRRGRQVFEAQAGAKRRALAALERLLVAPEEAARVR